MLRTQQDCDCTASSLPSEIFEQGNGSKLRAGAASGSQPAAQRVSRPFKGCPTMGVQRIFCTVAVATQPYSIAANGASVFQRLQFVPSQTTRRIRNRHQTLACFGQPLRPCQQVQSAETSIFTQPSTRLVIQLFPESKQGMLVKKKRDNLEISRRHCSAPNVYINTYSVATLHSVAVWGHDGARAQGLGYKA